MSKSMAVGALSPTEHAMNFLFCLVLILTAGSCTVAQSTTQNDWVPYTNEEYGYSFDYPPEVQVQESGKDNRSIELLVDSEQLLEITAQLNELPGDAVYFLDTPSSGERRIGDIVWSEYVLPDGYCDGPDCSPPIYALRFEHAQILFTIIIRGQKTTNGLQESILTTVRFGD